jgi:hypothetical protein
MTIVMKMKYAAVWALTRQACRVENNEKAGRECPFALRIFESIAN